MQPSPLLVLVSIGLAAAWPASADSPARQGQRVPQKHHAARSLPKLPAAALVRLPARADGFAPAPMPDQDILAPIAPANRDPHVTPTLFRLTNAFPGDGYVYGSSPQGMDDKRALTIPGVKLSAPLR